MDFKDVDRLAEYRQGARDWVAEHVDPQWAEQQRVSGSYHTPELHALLAGQGWLGAGWPAEYGGTDNDPDMAAALFEEIDAAGLHLDGWATTKMISPMMMIMRISVEIRCRWLAEIGSVGRPAEHRPAAGQRR